MQIFYINLSPFKAAQTVPPGRQARLIQEACQMLCKGLDLAPFMRAKHPAQGNDLSSAIKTNPAYRTWVQNYVKHLVALRSKREGAERVLSAARELCNTWGLVSVFDDYKVPVRLPKDFVAATGLPARSTQPADQAVQIYRKLFEFKYGVKA